MAVTYRWVIAALECAPVLGDASDVVTTVHWRRLAEADGATAEAYGTVSLTRDPDAPFIPFADLTADTVIGWVEAAIGPTRLARQEAALAGEIQPTVASVARPLPWTA